MPRTVVLTEAATRRFEKALLDWWSVSGETGRPGVDWYAAALKCDRRTIMNLRNRKPVDRNMVTALFAAQAKKPLAKNHLALWELTSRDFEETAQIAEAYSLVTEAGQLYQGANYDLAEKRCQEGMALYRQAGYEEGEANAHLILARLALARGRSDLSLEHIECAFALRPEEKNDWLAADLHELRGAVFLRQGDWAQSRENYTKNLAIWKENKNLHAIADAEINLAALETAAKRAPQARAHLENARTIIQTLKDAPLRASSLLQEARLLLLEGKPDAAEKHAKRALDYWTFAAHPRWQAFSHLVLAEIAAKQGRHAAASQRAELSLKFYNQAGDIYGAERARQIQKTSTPES